MSLQAIAQAIVCRSEDNPDMATVVVQSKCDCTDCCERNAVMFMVAALQMAKQAEVDFDEVIKEARESTGSWISKPDPDDIDLPPGSTRH